MREPESKVEREVFAVPALLWQSADGTTELFLDSATDAERAEVETADVTVRLAGDIARAVGARLSSRRVSARLIGSA